MDRFLEDHSLAAMNSGWFSAFATSLPILRSAFLSGRDGMFRRGRQAGAL
jgi:hypothetical protein